jgi:hypothetical protein
MHDIDRHDRSPRRAGLVRLNLLLVCALFVLCAAGLAVFSWTQPTRTRSVVTYEQVGALSYNAPTPPTSVYARAGVETGDPVYVKFVPAIQLSYAYRFQSAAESQLTGSEQLTMTVSTNNGLGHTVPLQSPVQFKGNRFRTKATLQLATVQAIARSFARVTGNGGTYTVSIVPNVQIRGLVTGAPIATKFSQGTKFVYSGTTFSSPLLQPDASSTSKPAGTPTTATATAASAALVQSSSGSSAGALHTATLFRSLSVADVRVGSLVLFVVALGAVALLGRPLLDDERFRERVRNRSRFGFAFVDVAAIPQAPWLALVELSSLDGLTQVSRRLECPLLHLRTGAVDQYAVVDNGTVYRYREQGDRPLLSTLATHDPEQGTEPTSLPAPVALNGRTPT